MDPHDFLRTADSLLALNTTEADLRSAISRAYYCCYHLIRIEVLSQMSLALRQQAGVGGKLVEHGRLCMMLKACKETAGIGTHLENLKRLRHAADYELDRQISKTRASDAVQDARELIADMQTAGGPIVLVKILRTHLQSIHGTL